MKRIITKHNNKVKRYYMKKLLLLACTALIFSSCSKNFYQIYTMTPSQPMATANNSMIYENADCRISYNFWAEKGNPGFAVYNKTNKIMYIHLPHTFFVKNGKAADYYLDRQFAQPYHQSKTTYDPASTDLVGIWTTNGTLVQLEKKKTKGTVNSLTMKEKSSIIIPPHSYKVISEYVMIDEVIKNCEKKQNFPKRESLRNNFDKKTSPLTFKNIIAYSFDEDGDDMKFIQNEFWMSNLSNFKESAAGPKVKKDECGNKLPKKIRKFDGYAPNKFYNSYKGMPSMGYPHDPGKLIY